MAAIAGVVLLLARHDPSRAAQAEQGVAIVRVVRRDLVTRDRFPGALGYSDTRPLVNRVAGTLTALPREGAVLRRGAVIYRVDTLPVTLLYGDMPAWRTLGPGSAGADVRELQRNLAALGTGRRAGVVVNGVYDAATTRAVAAWQRALGAPATGSLPLGSVVFLHGARRVGRVRIAVGAPAHDGTAILETTSLVREATIRVPATEQGLAHAGEVVRVALPTGRLVDGRVTDVGKVASSQQAGEPPSVTVRIRVPARAANALDQAPLTVAIEAERKRGAIAVPVQALLALQGGGYALEVVDGHGARWLVPVRLGTFADGYVEISGAGIRPGVRVTSAED